MSRESSARPASMRQLFSTKRHMSLDFDKQGNHTVVRTEVDSNEHERKLSYLVEQRLQISETERLDDFEDVHDLVL